MVEENRFLDEMDKIDQGDADFLDKKRIFLKRFRKHLLNNQLNIWDKVTKRYFTLSTKLHIKEVQFYTHDLFIKYPSLRSNILSYIGSLGFSKRQASLILSLMQDVKSYDDVTIFQFSRLITGMNIPRNKTGITFIESVDKLLSFIKSDFDFYCYLWFLAKYGQPYKLMNLIMKEQDRWSNENFLARQVVSILPRLFHLNRQYVLRLLRQQTVFGPRDAASVASNINSLSSVKTISGSLYPYLFPGRLQKPYPLPKYLILFAVLSSRFLLRGEKTKANIKIKIHISDPWYLYWLKQDSLIEN